jgi:hypothetical protein
MFVVWVFHRCSMGDIYAQLRHTRLPWSVLTVVNLNFALIV